MEKYDKPHPHHTHICHIHIYMVAIPVVTLSMVLIGDNTTCVTYREREEADWDVCNISEIPWTFHKPNRNLDGGFNIRHYKLICGFFFFKPYNWTLSLACELPWPWGSRKCNDGHQSNIILLYTQVQLPFLSSYFCKNTCKSADTWKIQIT